MTEEVVPEAPPAEAFEGNLEPTNVEKQLDDPMFSDFVLAMTKAMSKTGYYSTDHPEGQRALMGLFDEFTQLMVNRGNEFSFQLSFSRGTTDEDVALYDGQNPIRLMGDILTAGAALNFVPKLVEYFHRQGLLSFTVGREITQTHFEVFIERMTRPPDFSQEHPGEELSRDLAKAGVREISVVFNEDRIASLKGSVPWRAELALTRLRKDLRMIPMLANASVEEMRKIKSRLMDDILRGLQQVNLIIALSQHLSEALAGQEDVMTVDEAESHLVGAITPQLLPGLANNMTDPWVAEEGGEEEEADKVTRERMLGRITERLLTMPEHESAEALVALYQGGFLQLDSLTEGARNMIRANALADGAANGVETLVAELRQNQTGEKDVFVAMVNDLRLTASSLIARLDWDTAAPVVDVLWCYAHGMLPVPKGGAQHASVALSQVADPNACDILGRGIVSPGGSKEACVRIMRQLDPESAVSVLIRVLYDAENPQLRLWAVNEITNRAYDTPEVIRRGVTEPSAPWYVVRNLLTVLRKVGDADDYPAVAQLYEHNQPQVRSEALVTMAELAPERAMRIIERALVEGDRDLRRTATLALANGKQVSGAAVKKLIQILQSERETDGLRMQSASTLSAIVREGGTSHTATILDALRSIIADKYGSRMHRFKRFAKSRNPPEPHLLAAVCNALGAPDVGSATDLELLGHCLEDEHPDVREAASRAISTIRATISPPPNTPA